MACKHPHDNSTMPRYQGKEGIISAAKISEIHHHANGTTVVCDEATCTTCGGPFSLFLHKKWLTGEQRQNLAIGNYLAEYSGEKGQLMRAIATAQTLARDYTPVGEDSNTTQEEGGEHAPVP